MKVSFRRRRSTKEIWQKYVMGSGLDKMPPIPVPPELRPRPHGPGPGKSSCEEAAPPQPGAQYSSLSEESDSVAARVKSRLKRVSEGGRERRHLQFTFIPQQGAIQLRSDPGVTSGVR